MADLFMAKGGIEPIEANQIDPLTVEAVAIWCGGRSVVEHDAIRDDVRYAAINVPTVSGPMRAQEGDWIIRRPGGDFYPLTNARFKELFEPVV